MPVRRCKRKKVPRASAGTDPAVTLATMERVGQLINIRPPCEKALGEVATALHVAAVHTPLGFLAVPWPVPLSVVEDMPWGRQAVMPAGLEPVARALLEKAGITVVVEPRTVLPLPAPEPPPGKARTLDPALLEFIRERERGLIRVGPGVAPELLVAQMRIAFPQATIAVAATRREDVRWFGRALKNFVPSTCWSLGDDFPADPGPLVVTTYTGLADHGVDISRLDIVICLDAREAFGRVACLAIGHADRARLFGLICRDEHPAPYDLDRIRALFGFDSMDIPRHGQVARPVEVITFRIVGTPPTACTDIIRLKRRGLWSYSIRNWRIARLAVARAGGDGSGHAAEFPALVARLGDSVPKAVILVEGIEHATTLARSLPGWPIVPGPDLDTGSLPTSVAKILDERRWATRGQPGRAIVTLAGMDRIELETVDLVIRADGGVNVPASLATGLAMPYPGGRQLLLVDFDDRHHPELRHRSRGRREAYHVLGWTVDGLARAASPLDLFPAARRGLSR